MSKINYIGLLVEKVNERSKLKQKYRMVNDRRVTQREMT